VGLTPEDVQHYTHAAAALSPAQVEVLSRGVYNVNSSGVGGGGGSGDSVARRASVGSTSVNVDNGTSKCGNDRRNSTGSAVVTAADDDADGTYNADSTYWSTDVDAATAAAIAAVATTGANTSTTSSYGDSGAKRGRGRPRKIIM